MPFPASWLAFVYRVSPKSTSWALRPMNLQSHGCAEVATSSDPLPRLSSSSRPLLSLMESATPWWPPALVQQLFSPMVSNPPRVYRFCRELGNMPTISRLNGMPTISRLNSMPTISRLNGMPTISGVKGMSTISGVIGDSGKPYRRLPITSANLTIFPQNNKHYTIVRGIRNIEKRGTISDVVAGDERTNKDACRTTLEVVDTGGQIAEHLGCEEEQRKPEDRWSWADFLVSDDEEVSDDERHTFNNILPKSTHRDGSIYRMDTWWKEMFHITDRNETRLEAMSLSEPTDCIFYNGTCVEHDPGRMLQIFSIEVASISLDGGSVELYGYIAARDVIDPLLNYVVSISRDDPIIVRQGSLINMIGPKRAIDIYDLNLIEYDLRIKTGEHEKDDLQLIDGASILTHVGTWNRPCWIRIPGYCGAVEINFSRIEPAVEATIEVLISEVQSSFSLSLGCLTSELIKEIQLFDGAISESCGLKRSVVGVVMDSSIDLKFKVGTLPFNFDQRRCTFEAKTHGHDTQEIKTDFALLSVKVTWSTLPRGTLGW